MDRSHKLRIEITQEHSKVTGSCFCVTITLLDETGRVVDTFSFLVDCGLFLENNTSFDLDDFVFDPSEINSVLLTHAHVDHVGRLSNLIKNGFNGTIFASPNTCLTLPTTLRNCYGLAFGTNYYETQQLLEDTLVRLEKKDCLKQFNIHPAVTVTFIPNAHLLGAVCIKVSIQFDNFEPYILFFSGDYAKENILFDATSIADYRKKDEKVFLVCESTYATTSTRDVNSHFETLLIQAIANNQNVILPVCANGKPPLILKQMYEYQNLGIIPPNLQIDILASACYYTKLYEQQINGLTYPATIHYLTHYNLEQLTQQEPRIIFAPSGSGEFGAARNLIDTYLDDPIAQICFTSFPLPGTRAELLLKQNHTNVSFCNQFSLHSKQEELIELIDILHPFAVLLNHGEQDKKRVFQDNLSSIYPTTQFLIKERGDKTVLLIDSNQAIKVA